MLQTFARILFVVLAGHRWQRRCRLSPLGINVAHANVNGQVQFMERMAQSGGWQFLPGHAITSGGKRR